MGAYTIGLEHIKLDTWPPFNLQLSLARFPVPILKVLGKSSQKEDVEQYFKNK